MPGSTYRKLHLRIGMAGAQSVRSLTIPLANLLLSLIVVRLANADTWGLFVVPLILVNLAAHLAHWGSKDFLLRKFSLAPATIRSDWQQSLASRLLVVPVLLLALGIWFQSWVLLVPLALWLPALVVGQSIEVLVIYKRKYGIAVFGEVLFFTVVVCGLLLDPDSFERHRMAAWWALGQGAKAAFLSGWFFRDTWAGFRLRLSAVHWSQAWPFFLVGFVSLLQSRIDLYLVTFFLKPAEVAHYQVLIGLLLYVQAMAGFTMLPYAKVLYRLRDVQLLRIQRGLALAGIGAAGPGVLLVLGALWWLYGFVPEWAHLVWGMLYVWPMYAYTTAIYHSYKHHREKTLLAVYVAGTVVNAGLGIYLIPLYGISGAMAATASSQWLILLFLLTIQRQIHRHQ